MITSVPFRVVLLLALCGVLSLLSFSQVVASSCSECDGKISVSVTASGYDYTDRNPNSFSYEISSGDDEISGSAAFVSYPSSPHVSGATSVPEEIMVDIPSKNSPTKINISASYSTGDPSWYEAAIAVTLKFPPCYKKFEWREFTIGIGDGLEKTASKPLVYPNYENIWVEAVDGEVIVEIYISSAIASANWDLYVLSDEETEESGSGSDPRGTGGSGGGGSGGYGSNTSAGTTSSGNGGQGAGKTVWSTEDIANATDLNTVGFTASSSILGVEKIETSSTSQKQLYVEDKTLVNVSSSGGVLTIGYYENGQVGTVDSNGFYTFSGTPYKEIVITQTSPTTAIYVTKENGVAVGSWTLGGGSGTQIVDNNSNRKEINVGGVDVNGDRTESREVWYTPTNQLVSKTLNVYKTFSVDEDSNSGTPDVTWEKLIRVVNDPDGAALTTVYTYETNPSLSNYKKVVSTTYPDGNWSYVSSSGVTWKPFKDGVDGTTPPSSAPANNATGYVRRVSGSNGAYETYINGGIIAKTEASSTLTNQIFGGVSGLSKVTHNRIFGTGTSDKLTSTSYYYRYSDPVEYLRGKLFASVEVDGTCTKYEYAQGTYSAGTFTSGTGTDLKTVAMRGYISSGAPAFEVNKSTANERIENQQGQTLQEKELLWNGSDFSTVLTTTRHTYDAKGNLTESKRLTSADPNWITIYTATYDVQGNLTSSTDEFGVVSSSVAAGRTTTYTTNDGLITRTSSTTVDVAGRVISETSDGLTTTYTYSIGTNGGKKVTKTLPSGATSISEYYLDGQINSVSGTGEVSQNYDCGATSGERITTVTTGGRAITTTVDMLGRTKQVVRPKFGGGTSTTVSTYNNAGQLSATTIDGSAIAAPQAFTYGNLGGILLSGYDVDGGGLSTSSSSPDRVMESEQYYAQSGGKWYAVSKSGQYLPSGLQTLQENWSRVDGRENITKYGDRTVTSTTAIDSGDASKVIVETTDSDIGSPSKEVYQRGVTLLESREPWQTGTNDKTSYTYTAGRVSKITDALGRETLITYVAQGTNGAGQESVRTLPGGATVQKTYTSLGLVDTESGTGTYWKGYGYNGLGELTSLATEGAAGQSTTTWTRDSGTGLVNRKTDAVGNYVEYTYNAVGWPTSRIWARGITTTYGYNSTGEANAITYSDGTSGASDMVYDKGGRLVEVTDASGERTMTYSPFGQRANETYSGTGILSGYEITRTFNQQRRASLAATGPSSFAYPTVNYAYNSGTRVQTITQGLLTTTYTPQSGMLQPASVDSAWSGGITLERAYGYDVLGRTTSVVGTVGSNVVSASGTSVNPITYDTAGRRTQIVNQDGSKWDYEYNSRNEVTSGKKKFADNVSVPGHQFSYDYDGIGNRLTAGKGGNEAGTGLSPISYTPNLLNQYSAYTTPKQTWVTGDASTSANITIDGKAAWRHAEFFGRELSLGNDSGPANKEVTVKANMPPNGGSMVSASQSGKIMAAPAAVTPTYDFDGNLTSDGLWIYAWDGENRLKSIETVLTLPTVDQRRQEYSYDFEGRLVKITKYTNSGAAWIEDTSKTVVLLYDGWNIVSEITGSGIRKYLWGNDLSGTLDGAGGVGGYLAMTDSENAKTYLVANDSNGNVSSLVAATDGVVAAQYGYGPFGETLQTAGSMAKVNGIRWSNKLTTDQSGLAYYGYRFYDSRIGRWINRDPLKESGGFNLYGLVSNNAVNFIDTLGLERYEIWVSAYIPSKTFTFPYPTKLDPAAIWYGDNRGGAVVGGSARAYHRVIIETDPSKFPEISNVSAGGITKVDYTPGGNPFKFFTDTSVDAAPPRATITRSSDETVTTVNVEANTSDPLVPGAPPLHYSYTMKFDTCKGELDITGTNKAFPAYDIVINSRIMRNFRPSGRSNNPLALLFGPTDIPDINMTIQKY